MASLGNNPSKRKRPEDSPDDSSKSVDVCRHCSKKCTKKSEAVQCDLCCSWLHASCEGLSKDEYKLLTQLTSTVENVMYYCKFNKCEMRSKQLMFGSISKALFPPVDSSETSTTMEQNCLSKTLTDLSEKIADLTIKQQTLHNSVQSISSKFVESAVNMDTGAPAQSITQGAGPSSNALDIIDEMADRDRRKNNIVAYNFPESTDRNVDIQSFKALSDTVFKLDLDVTKAIRLGPKIPNKHRPLLLTVEDVDDKTFMLSHSHFLKRHEQYNKVYLVPDRTRLERAKHKRVVDELKQRKANGETNLIIRNGIISQRQPRVNIIAETTNTQQATNCS